jgi:NNP family nitrate/nitrite transporter-like MFS transporter
MTIKTLPNKTLPGKTPAAKTMGTPALPNRQSWVNVGIATLAATVGFWAWALLSPLGPDFKTRLGLNPVEQALLVALPVVVGSLGRIPVGWLAGRYGTRLTFTIVVALTAIPTLLLAFFQSSYPIMLVLAFFLGLGGATYAIGVPVSNNWFPPARRGFSIGVFSACDVGVAVAGLTVIPAITRWGDQVIFYIVAGALLVCAVLCWFFLRDLPDAPKPKQGMWGSFVGGIRKPTVLQQSWLYAMTFGVYVALGAYSVTFFKGAYDIGPATASLYMAMLVTLAAVFRPIGGWLADRLGPLAVLTACFGIVVIGAAALAFQPPLTWSLVAFGAITAACGTGASAVFTLLAQTTAQSDVAEASGIVGALGGMGGYFPPLVLGAIFAATGTYQLGFWLLVAVILVTAGLTVTVFRRGAEKAKAALQTQP